MRDKNRYTADDIIEKLELFPHPEGGHFKEVYRSSDTVFSKNVSSERSSVTDIYFLLKEGECSRFHKVLHDEIWNFYLGDPLKLIDYDGFNIKDVLLGGDDLNFKYTIKANNWQAAESLGEYSLVGCTVAPGFDFLDFSFIDDDNTKSHINNYFNSYTKYI